MSRQVTSRIEIPASVDDVFALRTSSRWVERKAERLRDGSTLVERVERPGGAVDITVSRELPDGVPGVLQKFLPQDGRVLQKESWGAPDADGRCTGTWSVEIPGAPAQLGGTSTLEPTSAGCVQAISGAVKVSVPLIGGKAEQLIADLTQRLMAKEGSLMVELLTS